MIYFVIIHTMISGVMCSVHAILHTFNIGWPLQNLSF